MKGFLKFIPKLVWFQDVKFLVGLLMLVRQAALDIQAGKDESLALDGAVRKVYDKLFPEELKITATANEVEEVVSVALLLYKATAKLFNK